MEETSGQSRDPSPGKDRRASSVLLFVILPVQNRRNKSPPSLTLNLFQSPKGKSVYVSAVPLSVRWQLAAPWQ